ncbi:MAG: sensor histidine kinase [Dehalococcoidia bacterium]
MRIPFAHPDEWSLATRVIAAAAALLAVLLVIVVVTQREAAQERRTAEIENAADVGEALVGIVDGFARDLEVTTFAAAAFLGGQEEPLDQESVGDYLDAINEQYGTLRGLFVTDPQGVIIAAARGEGIGLSLDERPYMQELRAGASSAWGDSVAAIETGEITATFGREIRDDEAELRGYLVVAFYPPRLTERLRLRVPGDADISLFDSRGLLLDSSQRPGLAPAERDFSGSNAVQAALGGQTFRVDHTPLFSDGEARYGVVMPVSSTGWAIAFTRPAAPLNALQRDAMVSQVAPITIAVILVGTLLAMTTRRLLEPLGALAGSAAAIARGERPAIPPARATPEVRQLAEAMATMSAAVSEREDELRTESGRRALVADASRAFAEAGLDLDEELAAVTRRVSLAIGDGGAVFMLTPDRQTLDLAAINHPQPDAAVLAREVLAARPLRVGETVLGRVAASGRAEQVIALDGDHFAVPDAYRAFSDRFLPAALAAVPLRTRGRIIGVLAVWRQCDREPYAQDEVDLLQEIADRAALAIENARLFRELDERSEAVQRLVRVHGEAVTQLAHDLKNPLTVIASTAQLVERQVREGAGMDAAKVARYMASIREATGKASADIDASTDLARWQSGEGVVLDRKRVDLVTMLRDLVDRHRELSDVHRVVLVTELAELAEEWDGPRLERAFGNLLNNAIKYSPDGGEVRVEASVEQSEDGDWAVVRVSDQGMGIPPDALDRIFDRFYRATNAIEGFAGTGLGLSGVQHIVDAHGGTVQVESAVGEGTAFTIRIPYRRSAVAR